MLFSAVSVIIAFAIVVVTVVWVWRRTSSPRRSRSGPVDGEDQDTVQPYDAIPGPKGLPLLGTMLDYREKYKMYEVMHRRVAEYGRIFKEKITPGSAEIVFVTDGVDVEKVFQAEGKYPQRLPFTLWLEARKTLKQPVGFFASEGEAWQRTRSPISKFTLVPRKVAEYHEGFNEVAADLLKKIRHQKHPDNNIVSDMSPLLFKWSIESILLFVLGQRMGCLNLGEVPPDSQKVLDAIVNNVTSSFDMMSSGWEMIVYKVWPTKNWKTVVQSHADMHSVFTKIVQDKANKIREEDTHAIAEGDDQEAPDKVDFFTYLYHGSDLSLEEITMNLIDFLTAGADVNTYTLVWTLYCLATNPEAQEKLRSEVQDVIGSDKIVTPTHVDSMSYIHDCVKEALRLYPVAVNNSRILGEDAVLSGYKVPAGTRVMMPMLVTGKYPDQFPEPDRYLPERWSKENEHPPNPFSSLFFGFGPRGCPGRCVARLGICIALSHLIRNFRVEYRDDKPMGIVQTLLVAPERQLDLAFVEL